MRSFLILIVLIFSVSCSTLDRNSKKSYLSDLDSDGQIRDLDNILKNAEENASPEGKTILSTGRSMVLEKKIVRGSCWDYANAVFNKSGFKTNERVTPLKSKFKGPYADLHTIKAGDWLYFINYSYKESDHSGIFVDWTNFDEKRAVVLSYVGGRKKKPGSYKIYDLKHIYYVIRPKSPID